MVDNNTNTVINTNTVHMTEKQKVKEITDRLEEGLKELFESEKYKSYLSTMSKFHNYSFNNTLLIAMQKPEESSPNLCVNSSFSYVVLSTLLLSSRDLTEWSLVYHNTLSYQRFYDLHSIHYDHLEGLHQLI